MEDKVRVFSVVVYSLDDVELVSRGLKLQCVLDRWEWDGYVEVLFVATDDVARTDLDADGELGPRRDLVVPSCSYCLANVVCEFVGG